MYRRTVALEMNSEGKFDASCEVGPWKEKRHVWAHIKNNHPGLMQDLSEEECQEKVKRYYADYHDYQISDIEIDLRNKVKYIYLLGTRKLS